MKALLVNPRRGLGGDEAPSSPLRKRKNLRYPAGLYSIAAMLAANGFSAPVLDLEIDTLGLGAALERERPDVVGITAATANRFEAMDAARLARRVTPDAVIVVGGPHFTFTAEDTLRHIPEIDIVVRGEGEITLLELMRALSSMGSLRELSALREVAGLSYRVAGQIVHNPDRLPLRDLDELPPIRWETVPWTRYDYRFLNISCASLLTSRGCPINCTFCSTTKMWGKHVRWRSPIRVVDEIEHLLTHYGLQAVFFNDDTFTLNRRHLLGICDEIERRGLKFSWICQARVDTVNRDILQTMKRAGCIYIFFGVETGSQKMMESIHKKITADEVRQTVRDCQAVGILSHALFMYSLPEETEEDRRLTFEFMDELITLGLNAFSASPTIIYPGTEIETMARERGVLPPGFSWSEPYEHREYAAIQERLANTPLYVESLTVDEMLQIKDRVHAMQRPLKLGRRMQERHPYRRLPNYLLRLMRVRSLDDLREQGARGRELAGALVKHILE